MQLKSKSEGIFLLLILDYSQIKITIQTVAVSNPIVSPPSYKLNM